MARMTGYMTAHIRQSVSALFDRLLQALSGACANIFDKPASTGAEPVPVWVVQETYRQPAACRIERF